jgi:hypothetical protein
MENPRIKIIRISGYISKIAGETAYKLNFGLYGFYLVYIKFLI